MTGPGRLHLGFVALRAPLADIAAIPDLLRYWGGQLLSGIGSRATMFVLMTTVYIETGSLTQFALLFALDSVPGVLLSPVAGVMVDRFDRRKLHVIGDGGVALVTIAALILWSAGALSVPAIYALMITGATFEVIQSAASEAMYQQLIPKHKLVRVGAVLGLADELVEVLAPAIGVGILVIANAGFVFGLDLATFAFALFTLFTFAEPDRFRSHLLPADGSPKDDGSADSDVASDIDLVEEGAIRSFLEGARYLRRERGMAFVFVYSLFDGFFASLVLLMAATAAMELGGETVLASVQGAAGLGALVGMLLIALFGLRTGRIVTRNVVAPGLIVGLVLMAVPVSASVAILVTAAFVFMLLNAPIDATMQATYLASVPKRLIGRVSAVFDTAEAIGDLLLLLLLAPLIDRVLVPAVAETEIDLGVVALGGDGQKLDALLLVLGAAGVGVVLLNLGALLSGARSKADDLAMALDTAPLSVIVPAEESDVLKESLL